MKLFKAKRPTDDEAYGAAFKAIVNAVVNVRKEHGRHPLEMGYRIRVSPEHGALANVRSVNNNRRDTSTWRLLGLPVDVVQSGQAFELVR